MFGVRLFAIIVTLLSATPRTCTASFASDNQLKKDAQQWVTTYVAPLTTAQQQIIFNTLFILHRNALFAAIRQDMHSVLLATLQLDSKVYHNAGNASEISLITHKLKACSATLPLRAEAAQLLSWIENYTDTYGDDAVDHALTTLQDAGATYIDAACRATQDRFEKDTANQIKNLDQFHTTLGNVITQYNEITDAKSHIAIDEDNSYQQPRIIGAAHALNRSLINNFAVLYQNMANVTRHLDTMSQQSLKVFDAYIAALIAYLQDQGTTDHVCVALFSSKPFDITQGASLLSE